MKILLILFSLLSFNAAYAQDWIRCEDSSNEADVYGQLFFHVLPSVSGACLISIGTEDYPLYRRYLFNAVGDLIVFNSFGDGSPSESTGARSFVLLPLVQDLAYRINLDSIEISTPHGSIFEFSQATGELESATGVVLTRDSEISGENEGGVTLVPEYGLVLDEGWMQGELPRTRMNRDSQFINENNVRCHVRNSEIFDQFFDDAGIIDSVKFKFIQTNALADFLSNRCPEL